MIRIIKAAAFFTLFSLVGACAPSGCTVVGGNVTIGGNATIGPPAGPVAFRSSPFVPNQNAIPHTNAAVYQFPKLLPSDVCNTHQVISVRVANKLFSGGSGASLSSNLAWYTSDGTGNPTGAPLAQFSAQTIPGDGTFAAFSVTVTCGSDRKIVTVFSVPASTTVAYLDNTQFGTLADSTTTVNPPPVGVASPEMPLWWEFAYSTTRPRINVFGDSISLGSATSGTIAGPDQCAWSQIAATKDYAVSLWSRNAAAFSDYAALSQDALWNGANAVIELVVNNVPTPSATMYSGLTTTFNSIRASTTGNIYANDCGAVGNSALYGAFTANQSGYNVLFAPNNLGFTATYSRGATQATGGEADNTTPANLYGPYDCGDHLHLNLTGQTAEATAWLPKLLL